MTRRLTSLIRRCAFVSALAACGSRTGLFVDDGFLSAEPGPARDATADAPFDAAEDAAEDAAQDAPFDDADRADAELPPIDARTDVEVRRDDCPDADSTLIYTITSTYDLESFDPSSGQFRSIGRIQCPTPTPATPFSMAVDRRGTAYVLFTDNLIYRVSTRTAACVATTYRSGQSGFQRFGMSFGVVGSGEALYVSGDGQQPGGGASGLGRIDPLTFALTSVGAFSPAIDSSELTGTGDGRLFAFYRKGTSSSPSYIGEINPDTAAVIGERRFDTVDQGEGWAFANWGGDFYMFHAPNGQTRVTRWRPSDDTVALVATSTVKIVGAGVSTCAPQ